MIIGISTNLDAKKFGDKILQYIVFAKKKSRKFYIPHIRDDLISSGIVRIQIVPNVISGPFAVGALKIGANTPHIKDIDYSIPGAHDEDRSGSHHARGQGAGLRALQCKKYCVKTPNVRSEVAT